MQHLSSLIPKCIRITHFSDSHEIVNNWAALEGGVCWSCCKLYLANGKRGNKIWFTEQRSEMRINPEPQLYLSALISPLGLMMKNCPLLQHTDACLNPSNTRPRTFRHTYSPPAGRPPPTSCLCSELEWLVFHFGLPRALLHSVAWPVYHYQSLSLTWTNRGPFSKVVSQVAVTDVSGTVGPRAPLRHTGI